MNPTPTPPPAIDTVVGSFLFGHWLGQGLVLGFILFVISVMVRPLRRWLAGRWKSVVAWLRDLRITRESTISRRIREAQRPLGEEREAKASTEWGVPERSEEELQAERDSRTHERATADQWVLSTYRSARHGYAIQNYAARNATFVRLAARGDSFEFLGDHSWDEFSEGESKVFLGRIKDPTHWEIFRRALIVRWVDDHGDEREGMIQMDAGSG